MTGYWSCLKNKERTQLVREPETGRLKGFYKTTPWAVTILLLLPIEWNSVESFYYLFVFDWQSEMPIERKQWTRWIDWGIKQNHPCNTVENPLKSRKMYVSETMLIVLRIFLLLLGSKFFFYIRIPKIGACRIDMLGNILKRKYRPIQL